MIFADDVVLYSRENDVMELELEQWREALETRGMEVSRAKAEYIVSEWNASVKCYDAICQAATGNRIQI